MSAKVGAVICFSVCVIRQSCLLNEGIWMLDSLVAVVRGLEVMNEDASQKGVVTPPISGWNIELTDAA